MQLPLQGLRILAIEQYGAGPFGTQHLADLGAEIIKIENRKRGGDYARTLGPYFIDDADTDVASLFFQAVNRNKKSLSLDFTSAEGWQVLLRLVKSADAVANNLRGDVPDRLGLVHAALKSANPAIVCAHCSAYGREGPRRDWPGYDYLMQAEAGYFHMTGEAGTPPARMGLSVVDFMAGTYMALGLLAAIRAARETGLGRDVDISLFGTAMFNLNYLAAWALNSDYEPRRLARSAHPSLVPCQLYRTADGWIYVMCNKEKFWHRLCAAIDRPELAVEPRFASFPERRNERETLNELLEEILMTRQTAAWLERFGGKVPAAPVLTPREALAAPELKERGAVETVSFPGGPEFDLLRSPIDTGVCSGSRPCPPLGADTDQLLRDAGYSAPEIADLRDRDII